MATRTYHLRTRSRAGLTTQTRHVSDTSLQEHPGEDHGMSGGEDPQTEDIVPVGRVPIAVRLYSEVVTPRTPSPRREPPAAPLVIATMVPEHPNMQNPPPYEGDASKRSTSDYEEQVLTEEVKTPDKVEDSHWMTMVRRHAHESLEKRYHHQKPLTTEQTQTVKKAAASMTADQRQK